MLIIRPALAAAWLACLTALSPAVAALPAQYRPAQTRPKSTTTFRFVIVGDRTGGHVQGLTAQGFEEINLLRPDFVISVGDLIEGYVRPGQNGVKSPEQARQILNRQWDEFDAIVKTLDVPFIYIPGNHDISNLLAYDLYRKRYGPTYFSFDHKGVHFICLNSEEVHEVDGQRKLVHTITGKQLAWLQQDVAKHRDARLILVFVHKPLWQQRGGRPFAEADKALAGTNYLVIAGHRHVYSYELRHGRPYIVVGPFGAGQRSPEHISVGRFRHYSLATVEDGQLSLALIKLGGVLPPTVVRYQQQQFFNKLAGRMSLYRQPTRPNRWQITFELTNPLSKDLSITGQWGRQTGPWLIDQPDFTEMLGPGQRLVRHFAATPMSLAAVRQDPQLDLAVELTGSDGQKLNLQHLLPARFRRTIQAVVMPSPPTIDAQFDDWPPEAKPAIVAWPEQIVARLHDWAGPHDLSATFRLAGDTDRLYLAVQVSDDHLLTDRRSGDALELCLHTGDPDVPVGPRDRRFYRIIIRPTGPDGSTVVTIDRRKRLPGLQAAYRPANNGYSLELALPVRKVLQLPTGANQLALTLALHDRDPDQPRNTLAVWCGGPNYAARTTTWGRAVLPPP
ncbi:MAG: metallophosphoesterase [Phycisphaerae bacterium]